MPEGIPESHAWDQTIIRVPPKPGGFGTTSARVMKLWQYVQLTCDGNARRIPSWPPRYNLFRGQRKSLPLCPKIARSDLIPWQAGVEERSLKEFKRLSPLLAQKGISDLDVLGLAQHHGMATRLLDWTENALAALWFAIHETDYTQTEPAVVWRLRLWGDEKEYVSDNDRLNPFAVESTKVFCPDHSHERIRAQGGWFTLHHRDETTRSFPPLEKQPEYLANAKGDNCRLSQIEIDPRGGFQMLRVELEDCGVTAASIYPDLGGLCQRITESMSYPVRQR